MENKFTCKQFGTWNKSDLFLLLGWKTSWILACPLGILLSFLGYHIYIYSYDDAILGRDINKTVEIVEAVVCDVSGKIETSKSNNITVFGTSLGTIITLRVANQNPEKVKKIILNTSGFRISETVWSWDTVFPEFKKDLVEQNITLNQLMESWKSIEPENNFDNLTLQNKILFFIAEKDEIIPVIQGYKLYDSLAAKGLDVRVVKNTKDSHFTTGLKNLAHFRFYNHWIRSKQIS